MSRGKSRLHKQASAALALAVGVASCVAAAPAVAQGLPQHMVAYMEGAGLTQCPDNWTEAAYAQGRVILGTTDGSKIQKKAGTPATAGQVPQHDHEFKVTATVGSEERRLYPTAGVKRAAGGQVTSTGTTTVYPPTGSSVAGGRVAGTGTTAEKSELPFIQYLVCEHTAAESPDSAPYGTVAFFNAPTCPDNWAPLAQADGRFLLPASTDAQLGYATKTTLDPADPAGHTHGLSASFETQTLEFLHEQEVHADFAKPGQYTLSGTSAMAAVLPFVSLLVCEKGVIGNSEGIPVGTVAFFGAEDCPDGWGITTGAPGRFIIGIGGNGKPGKTLGGNPIQSPETSIQHDHEFSGELSLSDAAPGVEKPEGGTHAAFVDGSSHHYSGTSTMATDELPYLVLQACTYPKDQDWQGAGRPNSQ